MYKVSKRMELAGAHCLKLPYESKCNNLHGHNWIIEVEISGEVLNDEGMLMDFTLIKKTVMKYDHKNLNEEFQDYCPTAEKMAKWLCNEIQKVIDDYPYQDGVDYETRPAVSKVSIQESEGNTACYIP